jgi:hypothetical protein
MARTRGEVADPVDVPEEEVLGPEDAPIVEDETPQVDADGNAIEPEVDENGDPIEPTEGQDEVVDDLPPPRRSGGGSEVIRAQRRARQEAEERAARLERELAEARGFQQGMQARQVDPQAQARAEQEFYASLELMPPAQAYQAIVARERQNVGTALQQIEFRSNDRADKQAYDIAARTSRVHQQYRSQVEQTLATERAAGRNPDREVILKFLVGNDVLERSARAAAAQRNGAAARIAQQRTQPTGARSNVSPGGRRPAPGSREADEAALADAAARGLNLWDL